MARLCTPPTAMQLGVASIAHHVYKQCAPCKASHIIFCNEPTPPFDLISPGGYIPGLSHYSTLYVFGATVDWTKPTPEARIRLPLAAETVYNILRGFAVAGCIDVTRRGR
eukprot:1244749-Pyramimonas_sp.AAC.1